MVTAHHGAVFDGLWFRVLSQGLGAVGLVSGISSGGRCLRGGGFGGLRLGGGLCFRFLGEDRGEGNQRFIPGDAGFGNRLCGFRRQCGIGGDSGLGGHLRLRGRGGVCGLFLSFLNQLADLLLQKLGGNLLAHGNPADHGRPLGGTVVAVFTEQGIVPVSEHHRCRYRGFGFRLCGGRAHGSHPADFLQLLVGFLQVQLKLLNFQILPLQFQLGQGGVEAHQQIALLHLLAFLHQDFGHGLGVAEVDGLNFIGGHGAVALPAVSPVLGHAHIVKGKDLHRLHIALLQIPPAEEAAGSHGCHCRQGDDDLFKLFHWARPLLSPAARRPECDRFCPHRPQWQARG